MSFICRVETSSGEVEPEGDGGNLLDDSFVSFDVPLVGSEVGKGVALSLDARSSDLPLPPSSACVAASSPDLSTTGNAASGSFFG